MPSEAAKGVVKVVAIAMVMGMVAAMVVTSDIPRDVGEGSFVSGVDGDGG